MVKYFYICSRHGKPLDVSTSSVYHPQISWRKLEEQYDITEPFAEGNFAEVRKATKKTTKEHFAFKLIKKSKV